MSYLDLYRKQVAVSGMGIESVKNNTERKINNSFKDSPSYKLIKVNGLEEDAIVVTDKNNSKKAYLRPNRMTSRGDILEIDGESWIAINCDNSSIIYPFYIIQKSNNVLTYKDKNVIQKTLPCILSSATLYSDGMYEGKIISFPDDEVQLLTPFNEDTSRFKINQRFIFNHTKVFKISSFDEYSFMDLINGVPKGVLKIHLVRDEERPNLDNFKDNLADNSELNEMPILLQIPTKIIELKTGDSFKITPTLTKNGQIVTDINELNKIIYSIAHDTVATISTDGVITAIGNGGVDIEVKYESQTIKVECYVSPANIAKYSIQLTGVEIIKDGRYNIYSMKLFDDKGLEVVPTNTMWELVNVDVLASDLAYVYSSDNVTCKVKCHSNLDNIGKKFKLRCTSNGVFVEKLIEIVSAF